MLELAKSEPDSHPESNPSAQRDSRTLSQVHVKSEPQSPGLPNLSSSSRTGHSTTIPSHPIRIPGTGITPVETLATTENGPGPTRHPKPLTPAELFAQLEKEQEAVVNRLTRELSILRAAHNSSVVSNSSSTSASILPESIDYNSNHLISGSSYPSPSFPRRHRSSSAASNFSNAAGIPASMVPCVAADRTRGMSTTKHDGSLGTCPPGAGITGRSRHDSLSRGNIQGPHHGAGTSPNVVHKFPGQHFPIHSVDTAPSCHQLHPTMQRYYPGPKNGNALNLGAEKEGQFSNRFLEMSLNYEELENVKKENEFLRQRVKELENLLTQVKEPNSVADTGPHEIHPSTT
ncbi:hypothetical protein K3495_g4467 [Podosphaera aphanis]|nr:hypothetical protein K3495_g4467 [Podosphaera aphanis]